MLRDPGLRGIQNLAERRQRIAELDLLNPAYRREFETERQSLKLVRGFFNSNGGIRFAGRR